MDLDEKAMLKKTLELSQENNRILNGMKRQMLFGRIFKIVYWTVILGTAVGLYYYIDPYIGGAFNAYSDLKMDLRNFGGFLK